MADGNQARRGLHSTVSCHFLGRLSVMPSGFFKPEVTVHSKNRLHCTPGGSSTFFCRRRLGDTCESAIKQRYRLRLQRRRQQYGFTNEDACEKRNTPRQLKLKEQPNLLQTGDHANVSGNRQRGIDQT